GMRDPIFYDVDLFEILLHLLQVLIINFLLNGHNYPVEFMMFSQFSKEVIIPDNGAACRRIREVIGDDEYFQEFFLFLVKSRYICSVSLTIFSSEKNSSTLFLPFAANVS